MSAVIDSCDLVGSLSPHDDAMTSIRAVRSIMARLGLPAELVLHIVDLADYHPIIRMHRAVEVKLRASEYEPPDSARVYLVSPPIPGPLEGGYWRAKKVTWEIEGHDQGWADDRHGTYGDARSWYEASIIRRTHAAGIELATVNAIYRSHHSCYALAEELQRSGWSLIPNKYGTAAWRVQSNCIACARYEYHKFEWTTEGRIHAAAWEHGGSNDDGFVEALRPGDRVALWMRAAFRGWENWLKRAAVQVMYETD